MNLLALSKTRIWIETENAVTGRGIKRIDSLQSNDKVKAMNEKEKQTLKSLSDKIKSSFPDSKLWLFGSRVTGTARPDSDYDLMVVYKHDFEKIKISEIIWEIGFENDMLIVGSYIPEEIFSNPKMKHSFFIQNVITTGIAI
jgi:predicted nucleotidyltransferase